MFPIDWVRITRAKNLKPGEFAFLPERDFERVLVGTDKSAPDYTIAVLLDTDHAESKVGVVEKLEGPAFVVDKYRFEGVITSLHKLDAMDDRYGALAVSGAEASVVVRHPHEPGLIKVGDLEEENPSGIPFAYRKWRIVKDRGQSPVELYSKTE